MADWDVAPVRAYLEALLPVVLDAQPENVRASLADNESWVDVAASFVQDASETVVFVDQTDLDTCTRYTLSKSPTWSQKCVSMLALVKRQAVLDLHAPLACQVRVVTLQAPRPEHASSEDVAQMLETPYETMEHVVHNVMTPWIDAYVAGHADETNTKDEEGKTGMLLIRRKLAELELSLRHAQQDVEIPHVVLSIHPAIRAACERDARGIEAIQPPSLLEDDALSLIHI